MKDSLLWRAISSFDLSQGLMGGILMLAFGAIVVFTTRWRSNCDRRDRK